MDIDQHAALAPVFSVTVAGADLPPEMKAEVTMVCVEQAIDAAGTFAIELSNAAADEKEVSWSDDQLLDPGGEVEIRLGYDGGATPVVLTGEITGLELAFPETGPVTATVRGYDRLHRLRRGRRSRAYLDVKDSDVATRIAGDLGLTADAADSGEVHPILLQADQSDLDFLLARAQAIGYEVLVRDKTLVFRARAAGPPGTGRVSHRHGLLEFLGYLSTSDQVSGVVVRGWDPMLKEALVGRAKAADVAPQLGDRSGPQAAEGLFGAGVLSVMEQPVRTQREADLLAKGILNDLALRYVTAEATVIGDPSLTAGSLVEFSGLGRRFNGRYYVVRLAHVWDGRFVTRLWLRRNAT
ncbi:phage late control D family protein [Streptomyces sp. UC4497]